MKKSAKRYLMAFGIAFILYCVGCGARFPTLHKVEVNSPKEQADHICEVELPLWAQEGVVSHSSWIDPPTGVQVMLHGPSSDRIVVSGAKGSYRYDGGSWHSLQLAGSEWYGAKTAHYRTHHIWFVPQESERLEAMRHTKFRPIKPGRYEFTFNYTCNGVLYEWEAEAVYTTKTKFLFLMPWDYIPNQWGG